ncbi:MAG: pyridoxal-phosphate dependent enzyme [Lachnospiraceae bacterium]|nr:pyridoxal-phosphate dependent enzyme [Lachnospiraceae bacterium]
MNKIALFERPLKSTPLVPLSGQYCDNRIWIKRDDLIPFSFGGNKARKAAEFYKTLMEGDADLVMTYGSNCSNHCRVIANLAFAMGLHCHIISPDSKEEDSYNRLITEQFGATVETCPVAQVSATIDAAMEAFREKGNRPFFIMGGGHGIEGTRAYEKAYEEICLQQLEYGTNFDVAFHASGTGSTQAGLTCGRLKNLAAGKSGPKVVGISIARDAKRGREVIRESIETYLGNGYEKLYRDSELIFTDKYRLGGYGNYNEEVAQVIGKVMSHEGIPMDTTYVGKAFCGMLNYLREKKITGKNILFIHTGGTPLYFDYLKGLS